MPCPYALQQAGIFLYRVSHLGQAGQGPGGSGLQAVFLSVASAVSAIQPDAV